MKKFFQVKCTIPRYSENFNQDSPETKKFGISVIDYHGLVDYILKNLKKFFPVKCTIPRYSENNNPDSPETKIFGNKPHQLPNTGWLKTNK